LFPPSNYCCKELFPWAIPVPEADGAREPHVADDVEAGVLDSMRREAQEVSRDDSSQHATEYLVKTMWRHEFPSEPLQQCVTARH
jgi:hypothetical protein